MRLLFYSIVTIIFLNISNISYGGHPHSGYVTQRSTYYDSHGSRIATSYQTGNRTNYYGNRNQRLGYSNQIITPYLNNQSGRFHNYGYRGQNLGQTYGQQNGPYLFLGDN